ncbi:MAG: N-acetylmuramoyl-L-alanine amidase [Clostridia bacterium]|nr:N-acetylmuramoyl-L-alanine amidase [Clostridia bacterium]
MRWYIINVRKHKFSVALLSIALILIITLAVTVSAVGKVYGSELFLTAGTDINNEKIIIIDAGHGGEDSGAVAKDGTLEKDIALKVAFAVGKAFSDKGYAVVYTRTEDKLLYEPEENIKGIRKISDLKNRCKLAELYPEALFVSIHMNSFGDSKYSGLQVYYSENNEQSRIIADSVQARVKKDVQTENNRTTKKGKGIYVLENIENPAILIECGFLSNEEECKKLSEKEYQNMLSFSIVCGIIDVLE